MNNYLNSLRDKINSLPERYKREILKNYKTHFQEGLLCGKTENDIAVELGDVDYRAKCVISEYYIEHTEEINTVRTILKSVYSIKKIGIGTLNLLIVTPMLLSTVIIMSLLYVVDFLLLMTPILLITNLIAPNLPIHFGTDILAIKLITTLLVTTIGYILYKVLKKSSQIFFSWIFKYIVKSIKFEMFDMNKVS